MSLRFIKIVLISLLVLTVCLLTYYHFDYQKKLQKSSSTIERMFKEMEEVEAKASLESDNSQASSGNDFPLYSSDELALTGFQGTQQDVLTKLMGYAHLIPYESLEGAMTFIPEEAQILTHEWAFMPFGDGITGGYLLLSFKVDQDGSYPSHVKVMEHYLYGEGFKK